MRPNIPIPDRFLSRITNYNIKNVHGANVVAKIAISPSLIIWHISDLEWRIKRNKTPEDIARACIVGVDINRITDSKRTLLVFYTEFYKCLVFEFNGQTTLPQSMNDYLKNSDICFVGSPSVIKECKHFYPNMQWKDLVVEVGELAVRVLKKPALTQSGLSEIAREVGVQYDESSSGGVREIQVDSRNPNVFTEDIMKSVISDAYSYYLIGCKLLI